MISNLNIQKLIENETESSKYKEDITNRLRAINNKINSNNEFKDEFTLIKNKILKQANEHMRAEFNRILMVKINEIKLDLESYLVNLEKNITEVNERGKLLKIKLEEELKSYLDIINQSKNTPSSSQQQQSNRTSYNKDDDFFDYDDDALMINESINEFSETTFTNSNNNIKTNDLEHVFTNINQIKPNIENFLQENYSYNLAFKECLLNTDDICLGHVTGLDLVTHESFQLDTSLADNLTYEVDRECLIRFSCPNLSVSLSADEPDQFRNNLKIDLYDSTQISVPIVLKERIDSNRRRNFQVYFKPNKPGIFKLIIKYKSTNVLKSPLYFVVLPTSKTIQSQTSSSISSTDKLKDLNDANVKLKNFHINMDCTSLENEKQVSKSESKVNGSDAFEKAFTYAISYGRGRLLRQKDREQSSSINSPFNILSQKRKSPSYTTDLNNNQIVDIQIEDENIMAKESSSKLQRANSMETDQFNLDNDFSNSENILSVDPCILSNHLKKYSKCINGRLLKEDIPSLKAKFVQKFSEGLNFPIGVRVCTKRNYLIVCNSSAHEIKIFNRINANEIHTIKSNEVLFTFLRPSALVFKKNELFIKDDKEIIVFDLDDNFKFLRKFGAKILQKPYGLAFNSQDNLVVVDANLKDPKMHVFDAKTGVLLESNQYEPVIAQYARSSVLNPLYYGNKADLPPIDKTKIRFIDSSRDHVYAADLGRSIIFKTTYEGHIVKAFGTFGKRVSQFYEPSGIHVDYDGKALLIGDSKNNRIQLYDSEGDYKCDIEFLNEKIVRPSDIHVDSEGYLYVSCFIQHCIKKFKLVEQ